MNEWGTISTADGPTLESLRRLVEERLPTPYGPMVLTGEEWEEVKQQTREYPGLDPFLAAGFALLGDSLSGMEVVLVSRREEVMPTVRELRRRGKRPVFVGMIVEKRPERDPSLMALLYSP